MYRMSSGSRHLATFIAGLTLTGLLYSPLGALPAASAATTGVKSAAKRMPSQTIHDTIKSVDDARSLTVTDGTLGALKVTLSKRGRILRAGKTAALTDFHAGDTVAIRGHLLQPGQFTATMIMDQASEGLAAASRRAPVMKVSAIDAATGQVTLETASGNVHIQVMKGRLRMTRKALGETAGLAVGQSYGVRLGTGPDGEPYVSLSNPTGATPRTRKPKAAAGIAPVGGTGTRK